MTARAEIRSHQTRAQEAATRSTARASLEFYQGINRPVVVPSYRSAEQQRSPHMDIFPDESIDYGNGVIGPSTRDIKLFDPRENADLAEKIRADRKQEVRGAVVRKDTAQEVEQRGVVVRLVGRKAAKHIGEAAAGFLIALTKFVSGDYEDAYAQTSTPIAATSTPIEAPSPPATPIGSPLPTVNTMVPHITVPTSTPVATASPFATPIGSPSPTVNTPVPHATATPVVVERVVERVVEVPRVVREERVIREEVVREREVVRTVVATPIPTATPTKTPPAVPTAQPRPTEKPEEVVMAPRKGEPEEGNGSPIIPLAGGILAILTALGVGAAARRAARFEDPK